MIKYEIKTDNFEFRFGKYAEDVPALSADEILEIYLSSDTRITSNSCDPVTEEVFDTLAEAKETFCRDYCYYGKTRLQRGSAWYLLVGELAWIEENEYDEDGEFYQTNAILDVAAMPYEPETED